MQNLIQWFSELFLLSDKGDSYIGLTHLRTSQKETPKQKTKNTPKRPQDIKISDIMRGIN